MDTQENSINMDSSVTESNNLYDNDCQNEQFDQTSDCTANPIVCRKCGSPVSENLQYCPKCGTPIKRICSKCGTELSEDQVFCANCGTRYSDGIKAIDIKNSTNSIKKAIGSGRKIIAIVVIIAVILTGGYFVYKKITRPSFNNMIESLVKKNSDYSFYESILIGNGYSGEGKAVKIGDNGNWMKVDTNPLDIEKDDRDEVVRYAYTFVIDQFIEIVHKELGFSDLVLEDMNETTWSMGPQTAESKKATARWTYHPDKGLEITYTLK